MPTGDYTNTDIYTPNFSWTEPNTVTIPQYLSVQTYTTPAYTSTYTMNAQSGYYTYSYPTVLSSTGEPWTIADINTGLTPESLSQAFKEYEAQKIRNAAFMAKTLEEAA